MNTPPTDAPGPEMEVRGTRSAAVIVQCVPANKVDHFLELQDGIVRAAQGFPGYQKVDIYPPAHRENTEWVVVLHFDDPETLRRWLDSPVRAEWIARFHAEIGESRLKQLPAGFASWFTGSTPEGGSPPSWKIALAVLLALYPTVMVLSLFVLPRPEWLGPAVTILLGNVLSVCILQWAVSPALNRVLAPWLRANGKQGSTVTLTGLAVILVALGLMTFLFSLVKG